MHLLKESFLTKFKEQASPLSVLGEFVYLRTYARYLEDIKKRETWYETVLRTTNYNINLGIQYKQQNQIPIDWEQEEQEASLLFEQLFYLRTFPSGRTLYMGGTEIVKEYPLSNYNCSFTEIENFHDFVEVFYLLMVGSGVGVRIDRQKVKALPKVRKITFESKYDASVRFNRTKEEMEHTIREEQSKEIALIKVGDSKEGWCEALDLFFQLVTEEEYRHRL